MRKKERGRERKEKSEMEKREERREPSRNLWGASKKKVGATRLIGGTSAEAEMTSLAARTTNKLGSPQLWRAICQSCVADVESSWDEVGLGGYLKLGPWTIPGPDG